MAKEFIESEFFLKYFLPYLDGIRLKGYPVPDKKNWESEYIYAYAFDKAYTELMQTIQMWISEGKSLNDVEKEVDKDIIEA